MKLRDFGLVLALLVSGSAAAESSNAIPDMNSVWRDYNAAVESGDADTVLSSARLALAFGEQNLVAGDERIAIVTMNYGTALLAAERQEEALEILELALERYEAIHGLESGVLIPVLQELADANANRSDSGQQAKYYERAAKIAATQYGESTTGYADVLLRSGKHLYLGVPIKQRKEGPGNGI